jgi:glyoxylase-like metal-dependent hydrolase (beta-lactamase superfamily II)
MGHWNEVIGGVWVFRDSCNVYAVEGPEGLLLIDSGSGNWLEALGELPGRPVALLSTHYFRDHSAGAARAAAAGIAVYVPEGEWEAFADPGERFRRRETYVKYDNLWDLFLPITATEVAGVLKDYDRPSLAGLEVEVVPLPGATIHQVGFALTARGGQRVVFCGEAIHSPGKLARLAPLQYDYQDLGGALSAYYSANLLLRHAPDVLCPSLGTPMVGDTAPALDALKGNLRRMCAARAGLLERLEAGESPALHRVSEHVWYSDASASNTTYLISRSGKAIAIDYGYEARALGFLAYSSPANRRALLHDLGELRDRFGVERLEAVLVSHFHDDHVSAIPVLQRLYGTECWAAESFADLLATPAAHRFPCNSPTPIRIDRKIGLDETVEWEEFRFSFAPMSGHTRFSALIGFEADGLRYAHTGDQYFFFDNSRPFAERPRFQNYVYTNGALLDGYEQSSAWLLARRPDIVLNGHEAPFDTDPGFFAQIEAWNGDYRDLHEAIMPLGADAAHFDLDSWGGWIWPYRHHLPAPGRLTATVTVRNPLPRRAELRVRLVGPDGWTGSEAVLTADPRAEVSTELGIEAAAACRRQPIAADLTVEGQPFGQVAEALVTVGGKAF